MFQLGEVSFSICFWIFWKIEVRKNLGTQIGWVSKKFLAPIPLKFHVWNPYGLGISHMKFEQNRRQKIFFLKIRKTSKGPPFGKIFFFVSDFDETQNLKSLWPRDFSHQIWAESEPKIFLTPNQFGCLNFSRLDFSKNSKTNGKTDFTQLKLRFEVTKSKSLVSLTLVLWKRQKDLWLSLIHIWRCRRSTLCRSRWSPYH